MKKLSVKRKKFLSRSYRIFIFLAASAMIVYMFPKEGKFRFEFQKGKPWLHETLIAPFDFPIYKTVDELREEKDSIQKTAKPYFKIDKEVYAEQMNLLSLRFDEKWEEHINKFYRITSERRKKKLIEKLEVEKETYKAFSSELIDFIYKKGVVELTGPVKQLNKEDAVIVLLNDNFAEEYYLNEIFVQNTAETYIINKLSEQKITGQFDSDIGMAFLNSLNLSDFIIPNYYYDEETTHKYIAAAVNNISPTYGMKQEGERLVSKGDVVNNAKFRVLESLKKEFEENIGFSANKYLIIMGQSILVLALVFLLFLFLLHFRKDIIQNNLKTAFIIVFIVLMVFIARVVLSYSFLSIYVVPFAILPIIIRTFYDTRLALFIHLITIMIIGFFAPNGFEFMFIQLIAGIMAIFSLASITRRWQLFLSALIIFLTYSIVYLGISVIQEGEIYSIDYRNFAWFAGNGMLLLVAYPLIYVFEKVFGFLSDVSLMELSDTNHPILRELAEKAPGTFQHSLQVGNLSEESIRQIGGNPLLARTGALYHDIGKMDIPHYFIENQAHGSNPHDKLDFNKSAEIIISHVTRGVEKAKKANIPEQIVDFIRTHHGTSKVQYFYRSYMKKYPDQEVDESLFTYPGPSPRTKEQAVVMMCDSVEAASRSMKSITESTIDDLVEKIVGFQISEDQFKYADITFKDITTVKSILKKKLRNIYHARIEYPEA